MPTVASLIVARLADAGVRMIFGVPGGGSNTDIVEASGNAGLRFVLSHTETAGALMAAAQAELTGCLGACLATLGPGVASIANGAAHSLLDRVPLLILTDTYPEPYSSIFQHQRLDHQALLAAVTKQRVRLSAADAGATLARAIETALAPPCGPVLVDCSPDVTGSQAPGARAAGVAAAPRLAGLKSGPAGCEPASATHEDAGGAGEERIGPSSADAALRTAEALGRASRRPLVLAGLGARRDEDVRALRALCQRHGVPALVTYKAKGVIPDDDPLFAGVFTNGALEQPVIAQADLLIGVGLDPVELVPKPWTHRQPVVACTAWPLDQRHIPLAAELTAPLAVSLAWLDAHLSDSTGWPPGFIATETERQRNRMRVAGNGLEPFRVVEGVARALPPGTRVAVDAGAHMFAAMALWRARMPNDILISNGLSTMGFALPAAIGAALLDPDRPVVALTGDAGLLMCAAELRTAAREGVRIVVVVFNDGDLSLIKVKQVQRGHRPDGVTIGDVAWPQLAGALGVAAFAASDAAELEQAVESALACEGPALVEARIDPGPYGEMMRELRG